MSCRGRVRDILREREREEEEVEEKGTERERGGNSPTFQWWGWSGGTVLHHEFGVPLGCRLG